MYKKTLCSIILFVFEFVCAVNDSAAGGLLGESKPDYKWTAGVGLQFNRQYPELNYNTKGNDSNLLLKVDNSGRSKVNTSLSSFTLKRELNDVSSLDLAYINDDVIGRLLAKRNIKILFFYLHPTLQVPLDIELRSLKLRYSHDLFRLYGWDLGCTTSLQALNFSTSGDLPFLGYQNEKYFVVLPSFGACAEYKTNIPLKYSVHADYLPVSLAGIRGHIGELTVAAEYRLSPRYVVGVGYRYSIKDIMLRHDSYDLDASYKTQGFMSSLAVCF
jgi:hypothetical protein